MGSLTGQIVQQAVCFWWYFANLRSMRRMDRSEYPDAFIVGGKTRKNRPFSAVFWTERRAGRFPLDALQVSQPCWKRCF